MNKKKIYLSNGADIQGYGALGLPISWPWLLVLAAGAYLLIRRRK